MANPGRTTLRDVALRAGVSVPTVSKVLHGRGDIGTDTRDRVTAALQELDYSPVGRPEPQRAKSLVVAFDESFGDGYETAVLVGLMREAAEQGLRTVIDFAPAATPAGGTDRWVRTHAASGVRGIILVATRITSELVAAAQDCEIALVAIDPKGDSEASVASIGSTNWAGMASVTTHLIELGHRRIAFAGLDYSLHYTVERFSGYRSSLGLAGIPDRPEYIALIDPSLSERFEDGRRMGRQLAELPTPPTAIVSMCDDIAFGVIEGARNAGLSIPGDLSVAGFDDIPAARRSSPPLTTVHQPLADIGKLAVRTVAEILAGGEPASPHLQLATSLVIRDSTRPLA